MVRKPGPSPLTRRAALAGALGLAVAAPGAAQAATLPAPPPLPPADVEGRVAHDGAQIWFATFGQGPPVILLHGGLASSDIWGGQLPALLAAGYRVVAIDSRGHGRSTRDRRPLSYARMETDVVAVMDFLDLEQASVVGWSDGAIIGLIMAMQDPDRVTRVFAFGANMDVGGLNPLAIFSPMAGPSEALLRAEYVRDTGSARGFRALSAAVIRMQLTQPNYTSAELAAIHGPQIAIADGDHDEIISHRHTRYLARTIPGAELIWLPHAGHFAPLQAPDEFNSAMLDFLGS
ncbi:MAG TPA: alpha/beta hydrolase [Caulobacteraceae bacterium]|jgi:pimeloyl-ACP methyl ester carboxylesterase